MTEKVVLPKEVGKAIVTMRQSELSDWGIICAVISKGEAENLRVGDSTGIIRQFIYQKDDGNDLILSALVNGYEVYQSPGEKVREYYKRLLIDEFGVMKRIEIQKTLDLLGMEIEGVNK